MRAKLCTAPPCGLLGLWPGGPSPLGSPWPVCLGGEFRGGTGGILLCFPGDPAAWRPWTPVRTASLNPSTAPLQGPRGHEHGRQKSGVLAGTAKAALREESTCLPCSRKCPKTPVEHPDKSPARGRPGNGGSQGKLGEAKGGTSTSPHDSCSP